MPAQRPPTLAQRKAAAAATADSAGGLCDAIRPFYWEIGDSTGPLASGSLTAAANPITYTANSRMAIASASKWIYAAYVAQVRHGELTAEDIKFLTFRSGYTSFGRCLRSQTVGACVAFGNNGVYHRAADGKFSYGGGHMEKHASLMGLGSLTAAQLAAEIRSKIGMDVHLGYTQPQLAGGVYTTPADYARFLRKMLSGELALGALLGSHAVCTNPRTCARALNAPVPSSESWDYSIGHWVEVDPVVGDSAFSSAGAFGFYPWIDHTKTWYGLVARQQITARSRDLSSHLGQGYRSAICGRLIRQAWVTGVAR